MWVTLSSGTEPPRSVPLSTGAYVVGRAADCELVVADTYVSQHHARLDVDEWGAWISDLGSTNGTFLDGDQVRGRLRLQPASEIRLGSTVLRLDSEQPTMVQVTPLGNSPASRGAPSGPPVRAGGQYDVQNAGPVAGHDVRLDGNNVAGRDLYVQEGFKLKTQMRSAAKNCIRLGCILFVIGAGLFGYFVVTWNNHIFDAVRNSSAQAPSDLPSPYPWLPVGMALAFAGIVLIVVGLLIPRDRIVTRSGR